MSACVGLCMWIAHARKTLCWHLITSVVLTWYVFKSQHETETHTKQTHLYAVTVDNACVMALWFMRSLGSWHSS